MSRTDANGGTAVADGAMKSSSGQSTEPVAGQKRSAEGAGEGGVKDDAAMRHSLADLISSLSSLPDLHAKGSGDSQSDSNRPPYYLPSFSADLPSLSRMEQTSFESLNSLMGTGSVLGGDGSSRLGAGLTGDGSTVLGAFASGNLEQASKRSRTGFGDRSFLEPSLDKLSVSSFDNYLNFLRSSSQSIPSVVQSTLTRLEEQESQPTLSLPITGIVQGTDAATATSSAATQQLMGNSLLAPNPNSRPYHGAQGGSVPGSYRNASESSDSSRESSRLSSSGFVSAVPHNTLLGSRKPSDPTSSLSGASSSSVQTSSSDDSKSLTPAQSAALRADAEAALEATTPSEAHERVHVVGSAMQPPAQAGTLAAPGNGVFVDITQVLHLTQSEAARRVGIPTSTLSKRWAEAVPDRKWPHRTVTKLDKAINAALSRIPSAPPAGKAVKRKSITVKKAEEKLTRLLEERAAALQPVYIRITKPDQLKFEEQQRKEAALAQSAQTAQSAQQQTPVV